MANGLFLGGNVSGAYCGGNVSAICKGSTNVWSRNNIPTPIYELPTTTLTGSKISTPYILLDADGSTKTGSIDKWTLFYNITSVNSGRLLNIRSQYAKTSTASDQIIALCGGRWDGSTPFLISYWYVGQTSSRLINVVMSAQGMEQGCGKAAYRRDSSKSEYLQYTIDGKNWYNLFQKVEDCGIEVTPYLTFGAGKGTISAKLWDSALDDISSLFNA